VLVCSYFDAFIENDKLFIVTELARGGDIGAKVPCYSVFLPRCPLLGRVCLHAGLHTRTPHRMQLCTIVLAPVQQACTVLMRKALRR
jgi:hypothetical protein